jgi:hypothetical protein
MRPEAYELVDAVRGLGIELTDAPAPKCLRITSDPETFWMRLVDVQRALEAFDRAEGQGSDMEGPAPDGLRKALDAVLRLYELQGGNMEQATLVVQAALDVEAADARATKKGRKDPNLLPHFAPANIKKKEAYKPRINLLPPLPGSVDMDGLRRLGFEVSYVEAISGSTLAADPHGRNRPSRPSNGMGH